MKIISILLLSVMVAISMENVRSEYLLVKVDGTEQKRKTLSYQQYDKKVFDNITFANEIHYFISIF